MTAVAAINPLIVFTNFFTVSPCLIFFDHPIAVVGLSIKHRARTVTATPPVVPAKAGNPYAAAYGRGTAVDTFCNNQL
jgi:hypothetical protein